MVTLIELIVIFEGATANERAFIVTPLDMKTHHHLFVLMKSSFAMNMLVMNVEMDDREALFNLQVNHWSGVVFLFGIVFLLRIVFFAIAMVQMEKVGT